MVDPRFDEMMLTVKGYRVRVRRQPVRVVKVGRNEPGPCGSGRKFKKCCGR